MDKCFRIKFKGKDFILVEGAITTEEAYANGTISYAHMYEDGNVWRYGEIIGTEKDIEWGDEMEPHMSLDGFLNLLRGNTWR